VNLGRWHCSCAEHRAEARGSYGFERRIAGDKPSVAAGCGACHRSDDPHGDQFGARECSDCHDESDWKQAVRFDHRAAKFQLTGAHARVKCDDCHQAERPGGPVRFTGLSFGSCAHATGTRTTAPWAVAVRAAIRPGRGRSWIEHCWKDVSIIRALGSSWKAHTLRCTAPRATAERSLRASASASSPAPGHIPTRDRAVTTAPAVIRMPTTARLRARLGGRNAAGAIPSPPGRQRPSGWSSTTRRSSG
jgi:hypothetical protein